MIAEQVKGIGDCSELKKENNKSMCACVGERKDKKIKFACVCERENKKIECSWISERKEKV